MKDYELRGWAKYALYNYPVALKQLHEMELDAIHGSDGRGYRDGRYRRGGVSNPTLGRVLALTNDPVEGLRREIKAVSALLRDLRGSGRRDDAKKALFLRMVYFERTHDIGRAARAVGMGRATGDRWNRKLLDELGQRLKGQ